MNFNRFRITAIAICIALPALTSAHAEDHKVMSYYVRQNPQNAPDNPAQVPNTVPREQLTILNTLHNSPPSPQDEAPPPDIQKESAEAAWERYKTLSTGKAPEPMKASEPAKPQIPSVEPPSEISQMGIGGLLQQYQSNKAKRSQMNTLRVSPASTVNPASAGN